MAEMSNKIEKKAGAFRTIREVAEYLNVEQHVLRFWETKFSQIKPLKRGGGRRYYRPEDVAVLERIHDLLYNEKYTIKGAQNVLKGKTRNKIAANANISVVSNIPAKKIIANNAHQPQGLGEKQVKALQETLKALKSMRSTLDKVV